MKTTQERVHPAKIMIRQNCYRTTVWTPDGRHPANKEIVNKVTFRAGQELGLMSFVKEAIASGDAIEIVPGTWTE